MNTIYIYIYPNVKFVKGYKRNLIYDLYKGEYYSISDSYYCFFKDKPLEINIHHQKYLYKGKNITGFIKFVIDRNLGILSKVKLFFNEIDLNLSLPNYIYNIQIEISSIMFDIRIFFNVIEELGVQNIDFFLLDDFNKKAIESYLRLLSNTKIRSIRIVLYEKINENYLKKLIDLNAKIIIVEIYNSTDYKSYNYRGTDIIEYNYFHKKDLVFQRPNILLYSESIKFNTYFYKYLFVSGQGEVKMNPYSINDFILIDTIKDYHILEEFILTDKYNPYKTIHKDMIDICKDCEFRYLCVDCREPIQKNETLWCYKSECDYNPYIVKWKGEADYINVKEWREFNL